MEIGVKNEVEVSPVKDRSHRIDLPKVAVFVDDPNMYISSRENNGNYEPSNILDVAQQFGKLAHAVVFVHSSPQNAGTEWWINRYRELGFETKFVTNPVRDIESIDVDTHLVTDVLETAFTTNMDVFVIASGDGDYVPLVRLLRKIGKRTVVLAHENTLSRFLSGVADEVITFGGSEVE